jgi:hypothetical protein
MHSICAHLMAAPDHEHMDAPISVSRILTGELTHLINQRRIATGHRHSYFTVDRAIDNSAHARRSDRSRCTA